MAAECVGCHYSVQGQLEETRDPPERCCGYHQHFLTSCPSRAEPIAKKMIVEPEERWFALLGASHHCPRGVQCSHCCSSVYSYIQAIQAYCASNSAPVHTTNKSKEERYLQDSRILKVLQERRSCELDGPDKLGLLLVGLI